jgi:hypothetical protein
MKILGEQSERERKTNEGGTKRAKSKQETPKRAKAMIQTRLEVELVL